MCKDFAFWVKSIIFTERLDFNMRMNIRYSVISRSRIDVDGKKVRFVAFRLSGIPIALK